MPCDVTVAAEGGRFGAPEGDCLAQAMEIARKIAGNDRSAVELTKQAISRSCEIMGMGSEPEAQMIRGT